MQFPSPSQVYFNRHQSKEITHNIKDQSMFPIQSPPQCPPVAVALLIQHHALAAGFVSAKRFAHFLGSSEWDSFSYRILCFTYRVCQIMLHTSVSQQWGFDGNGFALDIASSFSFQLQHASRQVLHHSYLESSSPS